MTIAGGCGVDVAVGVSVGVLVGVLVGVAVLVGVGVGVRVGVRVGRGVCVGVRVGVAGATFLTGVRGHFFTTTRLPCTIFTFFVHRFAAAAAACVDVTCQVPGTAARVGSSASSITISIRRMIPSVSNALSPYHISSAIVSYWLDVVVQGLRAARYSHATG